MKHHPRRCVRVLLAKKLCRHFLTGLVHSGALIAGSVALAAASETWTGNVNANWDFATLNWLNTATFNPVSFSDGDTVRFEDSGTQHAVSLDTVVSPAAVLVTNNIDYTFSGAGSM